MIRQVDYKCVGCGATATVSGGPSSSARRHTVTAGCQTCGQLDDVVVATMEETVIGDGDPMPPCRSCGSAATARWVEGDPCPRCGSAVQAGEIETLIWD